MTGQVNFEVFSVPNRLARKVARSGGPSLEQVAERAEAGLAAQSLQHETWLRADLDRLEQTLDQVLRATRIAPDAVREVHAIGHALKGHGANRVFPLIGRIADSLCGLVSDDGQATALQLHLVRLHLDAMRVVVHDRLTDPDDQRGQELTAMLQVAVQKTRPGQIVR